MTWDIIVGDCRESLRRVPERSVQTCITSPPYFGLRDYGTGEWDGGDPACDHLGGVRGSTSSTLKNDGRPNPGQNEYERDVRAPFRDVCGKCGARRVDRQIGLEPTPDEFVQALVSVFREVRRVLRDDGTVWLNLGDSYSGGAKGSVDNGTSRLAGGQGWQHDGMPPGVGAKANLPGVKPKDLIGIPWMVAFALRADGWYLRSDIIWAKPNPMPESVTDRPTKAHEYLFLLSKGPRYFYDADAIRDEATHEGKTVTLGAKSFSRGQPAGLNIEPSGNGLADTYTVPAGRNRRSVWTVATQPYAGAHFATFPPKLIEPCVLAGTSPKACGRCGAPWRRVVERTVPTDLGRSDEAKLQANGAHVVDPSSLGARTAMRKLGSAYQAQLDANPPRTVGWEPSCDHDDDSGSCIVLDPFAGAGTVGVVCGWHGRDFLGCELNPEYAQMARERIALEGRPGGPPAYHEPVKVIADQLGLLDGIA